MPDQFWQLTPTEFFLMLRGYRERKEVESRERWEQTRLAIWYGMQPHLKKSNNQSIEQLVPLPWDVNNVTSESDAHEMKMRQYERLMEQGAELAQPLIEEVIKWRNSKT